MAYEKQTWQNYPSTETPLNEDRLNHMEQGIFEASQNVGATAMIATPWTARVYRAGEYATNDGKVWLCLVPNSSAPTEGANWTSVTLGGEIRKAIGFKFSTRAEYDSWRNSADYVPGAIAFIKENSIADSTNIKHENTNVHDDLVRHSEEIADLIKCPTIDLASIASNDSVVVDISVPSGYKLYGGTVSNSWCVCNRATDTRLVVRNYGSASGAMKLTYLLVKIS